MNVAIIHDWLDEPGGAEKVLEQICNLYPDAPIYTLVDFASREKLPFLDGKKVYTSFLNDIPFSRKAFRNLFFMMPLAIEQFDLSSYDLVISSSYAVSKGVITGPDQTHICYCHSPIRYAWDLKFRYLRESGLESGLKGKVAKYFLHKIKLWDATSSNGVDYFIANSEFIARRIKKCYRRDATVIHPCVDTSRFKLQEDKKEYYFAASRLVPYKMLPTIAQAFSLLPDCKLIIAGDGPERDKIEQIAAVNDNITYLGYIENEKMVELMSEARAFVFAAEEDFGIIPVEAQACGTPVICYSKGGTSETVINNKTGVYFHKQHAENIRDAVLQFESNPGILTPQQIRNNALNFSTGMFLERLSKFIQKNTKSITS